jgi:hypothetical protein
LPIQYCFFRRISIINFLSLRSHSNE